MNRKRSLLSQRKREFLLAALENHAIQGKVCKVCGPLDILDGDEHWMELAFKAGAAYARGTRTKKSEHPIRTSIKAGEAKTEAQRRARVVHGWVFRYLPEHEQEAIRQYLEGGPVPAGYEELDEVVR